MFDLDAYLARIDCREAPRPDLDTLRRLHGLHPLAIPFENLSTVLGEAVPIDRDAVAAKLVDQRRGGYCFEHNTLLQAVLEQTGFPVTALAARVVWSADAGHVNPRTHMVLMVEANGARWLADVGFGGVTLTAPLEIVLDAEQPTPHETFRLIRSGAEYELQVRWSGAWRAMYRFDLQPQLPIDFEALNHYVATHPASHFRTTLLAGRALTGTRLTLVNGKLARLRDGEALSGATLDSAEALHRALVEDFGIDTSRLPGLPARLAELVNVSA